MRRSECVGPFIRLGFDKSYYFSPLQFTRCLGCSEVPGTNLAAVAKNSVEFPCTSALLLPLENRITHHFGNSYWDKALWPCIFPSWRPKASISQSFWGIPAQNSQLVLGFPLSSRRFPLAAERAVPWEPSACPGGFCGYARASLPPTT